MREKEREEGERERVRRKGEGEKSAERELSPNVCPCEASALTQNGSKEGGIHKSGLSFRSHMEFTHSTPPKHESGPLNSTAD